MKAVLLASLVALAGCVAPPTADDPGAPPTEAPEGPPAAAPASPAKEGPERVEGTQPAPSSLPDEPEAPPAPAMRQEGCTTVFVLANLPEGSSDGALPEGFTEASWVPGTVPYGVKVWRCDATEVAGVVEEDVVTLVHYWAVVPPPEVATGDVASWLPLSCASSSAAVAALFAAWDMPCAPGDVAVEETVAAVRAVSTVPGAGADAVVGGRGAGADADPYLARYFGVRDGRASWVVDIPVSASAQYLGPGLVRLDARGAPAPVVVGDYGVVQTFEGPAYQWLPRAIPP